MVGHGFVSILILRPRMTSMHEKSLQRQVINYSRIFLINWKLMLPYSKDAIYTTIPTRSALCFNSFHNFPKTRSQVKTLFMKKLIIGINGKLHELFMFLFVQSGKSTYVHTMINAGTCVAVGWRAILCQIIPKQFLE